MELVRVEKIKALATQASTGIYIHRYENPLLSARVKTGMLKLNFEAFRFIHDDPLWGSGIRE